MWLRNTHAAHSLEKENKDRVWKNTMNEELNMRRWFSVQGIYLLSFNLIDTSCHLLPNRALKIIFHQGKRIVMNYFLESGPSCVMFLGKECCVFSCVGYIPETETRVWLRRCAREYSFNQNLFLSLILFIYISHFLSVLFPLTTSPSFTFSVIILSQIFLWWSWM